MTDKEFGEKLEKRSRQFVVKVVRLSASLPDTPEARVIRYQLTKSASSIGANYYEANRSRSNNDFIHKVKICESETNETIFWLTILIELTWEVEPSLLIELEKEAKELIAIFTSVGRSMKKKIKEGKG